MRNPPWVSRFPGCPFMKAAGCARFVLAIRNVSKKLACFDATPRSLCATSVEGGKKLTMLKRPLLGALLDFGLLAAVGLVAAAMIPAAASSRPTPAPEPGSRNLIAHGWCTSNMSVTRMPGLKILWTGGLGLNCKSSEPTTSIEIYDPITSEAKPAGHLTKARYDHSALRLSDGRVLIAGGEGPVRQPTREVEIYDPSKLKSYA